KQRTSFGITLGFNGLDAFLCVELFFKGQCRGCSTTCFLDMPVKFLSRSEFCNGVAVRSSFGVSWRACLSVLAITFDGLYTFRSRCASSMTTRSTCMALIYSALLRRHWS